MASHLVVCSAILCGNPQYGNPQYMSFLAFMLYTQRVGLVCYLLALWLSVLSSNISDNERNSENKHIPVIRSSNSVKPCSHWTFQALLVNLTIWSPTRTDGNLPRLLTYPDKIANLTCRIESRLTLLTQQRSPMRTGSLR